MNENTIVAMVATQGVKDFLNNALRGLANAGIDPRIVHVARLESDCGSIDPILAQFGAQSVPLEQFCDSASSVAPQEYAEYGTVPFKIINWAKVRYLRWLLERHRHVVYSDVDVAWLADPLWYLQSVARQFPIAFQTEGVRRFPPVFCWGFMAARSCESTMKLFNDLLAQHEATPPGANMVDEQAACEEIMESDPRWLSEIYPLPETLFLNGLTYRALVDGTAPAAEMHGTLSPFTFHANWTIGLANKRALMEQTGTWLIG